MPSANEATQAKGRWRPLLRGAIAKRALDAVEGIAAALLCAARGVGEPTWEREALNIARRVAARPLDQVGIVDAAPCHGAAGIALAFLAATTSIEPEWDRILLVSIPPRHL